MHSLACSPNPVGKFLLKLLAFGLVFLLSACGDSNEGSGSDGESSFTLPSGIQAARLPTENITATISMDGGGPVPMTVTDTGAQATLTVSPGSHEFTIVFFYSDATYTDVLLASATRIFDVTADSNIISFTDSDYTYPDGDGDGITNLDELDEGSNPETPSYYIGGTVSGLSGSGFVIQLNGTNDLAPTADGDFTFIPAVADTSVYTVTVLNQPSSPSQTCTVVNGSGTVSGANVTDVAVTCVTDVVAYSIGGTISGLEGGGAVLQLNGGSDLPLDSGQANFVIGSLPDGSNYEVTVLTQPSSPNQTCFIANGGGTVSGADVTDVSVTCLTDVVTYSIGGTITGLGGSGLVLQNNGGDNLSIDAGASSFAFSTELTDGSAYAVSVLIQPSSPLQICTIASGTGTVSGTDITDVAVGCIDECVLGSAQLDNCRIR